MVSISSPAPLVCKWVRPSKRGEALGTLHQGEPWYDETVTRPHQANHSCQYWTAHLESNTQSDTNWFQRRMCTCLDAFVIMCVRLSVHFIDKLLRQLLHTHTHTTAAVHGWSGVSQAYCIDCDLTMGPLLNCHSWISISIPPHKDSVLAGLLTNVQYYSPSGEKENQII